MVRFHDWVLTNLGLPSKHSAGGVPRIREGPIIQPENKVTSIVMNKGFLSNKTKGVWRVKTRKLHINGSKLTVKIYACLLKSQT